nr:AMP-binding protein [Renibacterium salmoninarum]
MLNNAQEPLKLAPLLSVTESHRVQNLGYHEVPFDQEHQIHTRIEQIAVQQPDRIAYRSADDPGQRRTCRELNERANRLAHYLVAELKVAPGDVVALGMDRSILTVECIIALWKCGVAYMPIDPKYPSAFLRSILESAKIRVVLLDPRQVPDSLRSEIPTECVAVDVDEFTGDDFGNENLSLPISVRGIAYVI